MPRLLERRKPGLCLSWHTREDIPVARRCPNSWPSPSVHRTHRSVRTPSVRGLPRRRGPARFPALPAAWRAEPPGPGDGRQIATISIPSIELFLTTSGTAPVLLLDCVVAASARASRYHSPITSVSNLVSMSIIYRALAMGIVQVPSETRCASPLTPESVSRFRSTRRARPSDRSRHPPWPCWCHEDVQIEVSLGLNLAPSSHASGVPLDALRTLLVGVDDLLDMLVGQVVLSRAPLEVLGRVDEQDIIGLLALLQDEDADRDSGRVEQVRRQGDNGVDVPVVRKKTSCERGAII